MRMCKHVLHALVHLICLRCKRIKAYASPFALSTMICMIELIWQICGYVFLCSPAMLAEGTALLNAWHT